LDKNPFNLVLDRGKDAVPSLIAALKNRDEIIRDSAAKALVNIGKDAIPALISTRIEQY